MQCEAKKLAGEASGSRSNVHEIGTWPSLADLGNSGVETVRGLYPNPFLKNQSFERRLFFVAKIFQQA